LQGLGSSTLETISVVSIIFVPRKEEVQCSEIEVKNAIWSGISSGDAAKRVERARLEGMLLRGVHGGGNRGGRTGYAGGMLRFGRVESR